MTKKSKFFYSSRKPFNANDIDVNKISISKEVAYGIKNSLKYCIGYNDEEDVIRPLCLKHPQMIGYLKEFDDNITMSLRVDDNQLFKNYCKIWRTIKGLLGIEFDSQPVYGDTDSYIKTKVKLYDNKVNTNFQGKEIPKVFVFDYVRFCCNVGKKYYPQVVLEECKYIKRKNKMFNYINDDLEMTSSDDDDGLFSESDSESDN